MAYTYTAWPTLANLKALLLGAHVDTTDPSFTLSDEYLQGILDARAEQTRIETSRQFVAGSAGEIRYFDGSGTGLQLVDEYVDITSVDVFYAPGAVFMSLANYYEVDQKPWGKEKIQVMQGLPNTPLAWIQRFSEGRGNVKVTGTWGYGATIPPNVFLAVLQASAADAVQANSLTPQGQTKKYIDGDASEEWSGGSLGVSAGWLGKGSLWEQMKKDYKRPLRSHINKSRAKLY